MKTICALSTKLLGTLLLGAMLSAFVVAECGGPGAGAKLKQQSWQSGDQTAFLQLASDYVDPIIGMWHVKFTAEGNSGIPDGTPIDNGFAVWHSDGSEIMNSDRPPDTSNFCMGVWEKTAPRTYKLNHFGIAWDGVNTSSPIGFANIQEMILMDKSGVTYSGTFLIVQYDQSGNVKQTLKGTLAAKRITPSTPASSLF